MHAFLLYPIPKFMSRKIMTSPNDVRIICSPISAGKVLYMHRGITKICLYLHQCPCRLFSSTTQEPCHIFHNPNFKPVTHSPRYFGVPSHQSLKFIKKHDIYSKKIRHVTDQIRTHSQNNRTQTVTPHGNIKLTS